MKRTYKFGLLAVMLLLCLSGCGKQSANNPDKVYRLSFSMHTPADSTVGKMFQEMFDDIYNRTDGHVIITNFGSGTLAGANEVADMVSDGACDIGWLFTSFYVGQYPLSDVITIPLQNAKTCTQGTQVLWDLYENYPEMANEWSGFKTLQMYANPVNYLYSTDPISSTEEIKGKSVRSNAGAIAQVFSAWGANVKSMPPNDIYEGITKNNIQAFNFEPTGIIDFSLQDVAANMTDLPLFQGPYVMVMNWKTYNSLPKEYQEVFDSYATRDASLVLAGKLDNLVNECQQKCIDSGMKVVPVSDEDRAVFQQAADQYAEKWIQQYTTDTFDAEKYYEYCQDAYKKYGSNQEVKQ